MDSVPELKRLHHVVTSTAVRYWLPWLLLLFAGCGVFELHPYEVRGGEQNLNVRALERLPRDTHEGSFRFAVMGDIGVFLKEAKDAMEDVARRDVDFVVQLGDLTEFSSAQEYDWVARLFDDVPVPALAVIGNHDLLGTGPQLFRHHFGSEYLTFDFGGSRFVLFDSNSREYGYPGDVPDLDRLRAELIAPPCGGHLFTFSHVPPWHSDFDPSLRGPFEHLQAERNVAVSFHGHLHRFGSDAIEGVRYVVTDALELRRYLVVTVAGPTVHVEQVSY
ncbi:metallophosphoesterase family protein [Myxococcus stipitatus]|uniref:metallophosphoesterase family protein n=1 Tax=Myxococcus stipitatus TaxID=83455 RepID=UPI0030D49B8D